MKDGYRKLADNATRLALHYDCKSTEAKSEKSAKHYIEMAKHYRSESDKYLEALAAL